MKGIILHGGHGTRLRPLTHTGPKQLLPIANKPMSEYCLDSIIQTGVKDIAIVIGGIGSNRVKEYYKNGQDRNVNITYIEQDSPQGIAHAIKLCEDFIGNEKFLVFLGDNIIEKNISEIAKNFEKSSDSASILLCEVPNPSRFGIATLENNKIKSIEEKPKLPQSNMAVTGIYFLTNEIFDIIKDLKPSNRNELEITDALQKMLEIGKKISHHVIDEYWKDTGTPEDILNANSIILKSLTIKKITESNNDLDKKNKFFGNNTIVSDSSKIIEPILIGNDCIIDSNCTIGPNVSIGNNCHITDCNIKNSIIMSNCIIKGKLSIKNSIIANNSNIEKNTKDDSKILLLGEATQIKL